MSPAYDLNPNAERKMFATSVDNSGSENSIDLAMKNIDAFGLTALKANKILDEVKTSVSNWRKVAVNFGISKKNIDKMKPAFILP